MILCNIKKNVIAALEMLVVSAENRLSSVGNTERLHAVALVGSRCNARLDFLNSRSRLSRLLGSSFYRLRLFPWSFGRCFFLYGSELAVNEYHRAVLRNGNFGITVVHGELSARKSVGKLRIFCIEAESIVTVADIECDVNYITVFFTLEKERLIFEFHFCIRARLNGRNTHTDSAECGNMLQKLLILLWHIKLYAWAKRKIGILTLTLYALDAKFTAVINGRNAIHHIHHRVAALNMVGVAKH